MAKILIPSSLRGFTAGKSVIEADGPTAGDVILAACEAYPDIKEHIYDDDGSLRSYVNVFIGDDGVRDLATPVSASDTISIIPAIAGGCI